MINAAGAVAICIAIAAASTARAEIPIELRGRPIVAIECVGDATQELTAEATGIELGTPLTRPLLRSAVERLLGTQQWRDVQIRAVAEGQGARLVVILEPRLRVDRVDLRGNVAMDDAELHRTLNVHEGDVLLDRALTEPIQRVLGAYRDQGYPDATASVEVRETNSLLHRVVILRVQEGAPARIRHLVFHGDPMPTRLHEPDPRSLFVDRIAHVQNIEQRLRTLETALREAGYLEVALGPATLSTHDGIVTLTIVSHLGPHYVVQVRGASPLRSDDVLRALRLEEASLSTPGALLTVDDRATDLYRRYGLLDAQVDVVRRQGRLPTERVLDVRVQPGREWHVEQIRFPGARQFTEAALADEIVAYLEEDLPGSTLLRPVDTAVVDALGFGGGRSQGRLAPRPVEAEPRQVFYAPTYDEALEHLRELYQARGFLDARIGPIDLARPSAGRLHVVIPVQEGTQTRLHALEITGNVALSGRDIAAMASTERDAPFSYLAMEEARLRVLDLYRERGHLFARVTAQALFSADRSRALISLTIIEHDPVRVGTIRITGAEHTNVHLIRDRLRVHEGELYRPSDARSSEDNLMELGVFRSVRVAPEDLDTPARNVRVLVTVAERPTQYLDFGAGFSTGEGLRGGFEYGWRNILGTAIGFRVRPQFAYPLFFVGDVLAEREKLPFGRQLERNVVLGIVTPRFPRIRVSLDLVHIRDNERSFGYDKNGIVLSGVWRPMRQVALTLSPLELENNNVELFVSESYEDFLRETDDPRLQRLLRVPEGESTLYAASLNAGYDRRDHPFVPTRGFVLSSFVEWARTLRTETVDVADVAQAFESHHLRMTMTASSYVPLPSKLVWATQLRAGRVLHLSNASRTYPNRLFFLGGSDSMRAYLQDAFMPQDLADVIESDPTLRPDAILRGGDSFVLVRTELRFPVWGALHSGLFAEFGNLWADAARMNLMDLRPTAGAGARIETPIGPLAFDYGLILARRHFLAEPIGAFHFSIGLF